VRLDVSFPTLVRAMDIRGEVFELQTVLDNLSAGGLYMYLERRVELGTQLFAVVRLATACWFRPAEWREGPNVKRASLLLEVVALRLHEKGGEEGSIGLGLNGMNG
jgi:hypothetical protein